MINVSMTDKPCLVLNNCNGLHIISFPLLTVIMYMESQEKKRNTYNQVHNSPFQSFTLLRVIITQTKGKLPLEYTTQRTQNT